MKRATPAASEQLANDEESKCSSTDEDESPERLVSRSVNNKARSPCCLSVPGAHTISLPQLIYFLVSCPQEEEQVIATGLLLHVGGIPQQNGGVDATQSLVVKCSRVLTDRTGVPVWTNVSIPLRDRQAMYLSLVASQSSEGDVFGSIRAFASCVIVRHMDKTGFVPPLCQCHKMPAVQLCTDCLGCNCDACSAPVLAERQNLAQHLSRKVLPALPGGIVRIVAEYASQLPTTMRGQQYDTVPAKQENFVDGVPTKIAEEIVTRCLGGASSSVTWSSAYGCECSGNLKQVYRKVINQIKSRAREEIQAIFAMHNVDAAWLLDVN